MKKYSDKTVVVFRKYPEGDIIALFPFEGGSTGYCMSYQHVGQHGDAYYQGVVDATFPAKAEEYASLKSELQTLGYDLLVRSKKPIRNIAA